MMYKIWSVLQLACNCSRICGASCSTLSESLLQCFVCPAETFFSFCCSFVVFYVLLFFDVLLFLLLFFVSCYYTVFLPSVLSLVINTSKNKALVKGGNTPEIRSDK